MLLDTHTSAQCPSVLLVELADSCDRLILLTPPPGDAIAQLTDVAAPQGPSLDGRSAVFSERAGMVKAARMLLSSVTKVLVLADRIVIKQIITSRNKVRTHTHAHTHTHTHTEAGQRLIISC